MASAKQQHFLRELQKAPAEWLSPTTQVMCTADLVVLGIQSMDLEPDPALVLGLTKLVLDRHDFQESR